MNAPLEEWTFIVAIFLQSGNGNYPELGSGHHKKRDFCVSCAQNLGFRMNSHCFYVDIEALAHLAII
jgi:hypothetical protein